MQSWARLSESEPLIVCRPKPPSRPSNRLKKSGAIRNFQLPVLSLGTSLVSGSRDSRLCPPPHRGNFDAVEQIDTSVEDGAPVAAADEGHVARCNGIGTSPTAKL